MSLIKTTVNQQQSSDSLKLLLDLIPDEKIAFFQTAFGRFDVDKSNTLDVTELGGRVSISGQHEETLVVRSGGHLERIDTMDLGLPIGMDDDIADFIDHTIVELNSGDGVVLYTDGIPEAFDINKKQYGMERLCQVISQNWQYSAQAIKQAVIDDVRAFIGEQKVFDDITLVILKKQ